MSAIRILYVFVFAVLGFSTAQASRVDEINQVFANYNKRFPSGSYVRNKAMGEEFTSVQENFAARMKAAQALKPILVIKNDYDTSLVVTLYLLVDEKNSILALYHEKSAYESTEERSFLRFRLPSALEKGVGFIPVDSGYALTIKSFYFKPESSTTIQFIYLADLMNSKFSTLNLFLLKRNNSWDFYTEKYQLVRTADVRTWTSFFPPNGGVKTIQLY